VDFAFEVLQCFCTRQLAEDHELGSLLKGALFRQLFYRDSALFEDALVAVDEADGGLATGNALVAVVEYADAFAIHLHFVQIVSGDSRVVQFESMGLVVHIVCNGYGLLQMI